MNVRPIHALLALIVGGLVMQGCYMVDQPGPVTNFLTGGNEKFANAIRRAAADWASHGLEIANYVTVDDGRAGLPIMYATQAEMKESCPDGFDPRGGCTHWWGGDWQRMLINEDYDKDPAWLSYAVQHEMIHALVPKAPHTKNRGLFSARYTTSYITREDMANLARYTDVTESQVPFVEDADEA